MLIKSMLITRHADAVEMLADTRYVPPPVRQDASPGTLAWLRSQVSRFSTGEVHAERRRLVARRLNGLDPAALRRAATAATLERDGDWPGVPTAVRGAALGVSDEKRLVGAVETAAAGYLSGEEGPESDAAVADLVDLLSGDVANITILLQAHAATSGLIANALEHVPGGDVEGLLHETLRHDPPLKATRRLDHRTGEEVAIDLVAANRDPTVFAEPERFDARRGPTPHLTFGSGVRPCPASAHALALAAGVLEGVLRAKETT
jgi:cytochrome P450